MCNINIFLKPKHKKEAVPFLMQTTGSSYESNSDGEGVYIDGYVERRLNKINILKQKKRINNSKMILTHQRKSTSGFSNKYTHPFTSSEFVLLHNGVMNEFLEDGSDTSGFFIKFNKEFNKIKGTRQNRIVKSIKSLLDNLGWGSYSIAILDKKTNCLYYFKNDGTNIHFYKNKDSLYITTSEKNKVFLELFEEKFYEKNIKDYNIYKITNLEKINIKVISRIKKPEEVITIYQRENTKALPKSRFNSFNSYSATDLICASEIGKCRECQELTYGMNPFTYERICERCWDELWVKERDYMAGQTGW